MVVIEPAMDSAAEEPSSVEKRENGRDPEASVASTDEGFETASDGEEGGGGGDDDDDEGDDGFPTPPAAPSRGESYEDALNDEQLKQKALSQANDAKGEGNKLFGAGQYEDALEQYVLALQLAPEIPSSVELRSICHANSAACFSKLGKHNDTIKECTKALELNPTYMKALVRRGEAHEKLENFEDAIADMKKILELDPSNLQARRAIQRLEPLAAEKREKMKEEMIGKLKDLGNNILGRFGMSVDNFKAVKDPNTGSYSISFQK